jgi:hypothetical protein
MPPFGAVRALGMSLAYGSYILGITKIPICVSVANMSSIPIEQPISNLTFATVRMSCEWQQQGVGRGHP